MHKRLFFLFQVILVACFAQQSPLLPLPDSKVDINSISIASCWQGLGPFKYGTREAIWGADPTEALGGFDGLSYEKGAKFRSPLGTSATITWSEHEVKITQTTDTIQLDWDVGYHDVDWRSAVMGYGWSALQYQTWLRGEILNKNTFPVKVMINTIDILEYTLNGKTIFGADFFGFQRASTIAELKPGTNILNVRFVHDIRAHGGLTPPIIGASMSFKFVEVDAQLVPHSLVSPEMFDGKLPSRYIGVTVQNTGNTELIFHNCDIHEKPSDVVFLRNTTVKIVPGQARPLSLIIKPDVTASELLGKPAFARLCYGETSSQQTGSSKSLDFIVVFKQRQRTEAHRFTFLHPSGSVSYAILKAPKEFENSLSSNKEIPLLVGLHGAGVDADSDQMRHALDEVDDLPAFFLYPTGMSPWGGDDWHTVGLADVLTAIDAVKDWQEAVSWQFANISTERVLVSGHSNGGQGTWYFLTHLPDRTFAAVASSGFTSIENYVPYDFWNIADQDHILSIARKNFRNEYYINNLAGIPLIQQHGSNDDNVPPYHSRLMSFLRAQAFQDSDYNEVAGKPHWWEGVMTTPPLRHFYQQHLAATTRLIVPDHFSFIVANSDDFGSRYGIEIDQLRSPDHLARIWVDVDRAKGIWRIRTFNVHRFHIDTTLLSDDFPKSIYLDHENESRPAANTSFTLSPLGKWIAEKAEWRTLSARSGRQRGSLEAVLRSEGPFQIVDYSASAPDLLVAIASNLLQYFGVPSDIVNRSSYEHALVTSGNMITLALGTDVPEAQLPDFPVQFNQKGIVLKAKTVPDRLVKYSSGLSAAFLRPLPGERLELVIWGQDFDGLQQAMRMIPTLTGGGQPDFIIMERDALWLGHGGAVALGFFDRDWSISAASYV